MAQGLGIIDITWRGKKLEPEKGAELELGGLKNNSIPAGRRAFRAQEWVPSKIKATVPFQRGQSIGDLYPSGEGELICVCDTGQTFAFNDAFLVGRPKITGGEGGKLAMEWEAGEAMELMP